MSSSGLPEVTGPSVIKTVNDFVLQNREFIAKCRSDVASDPAVKKDQASQEMAVEELIKAEQIRLARRVKIAMMEVITTEQSFMKMIRDLTHFIDGVLQNPEIVANLPESQKLMLNEVFVQYRQIQASPLILNLVQEHGFNFSQSDLNFGNVLSDEDADKLFNLLNSTEGLSAVTRSIEDQFVAIRNFPALAQLAESVNFETRDQNGVLHVVNLGASIPDVLTGVTVSSILIQAVQRPPRYKLLYEAMSKEVPDSSVASSKSPSQKLSSSISEIADTLTLINSAQQYEMDEFSHRVYYGQVAREIYAKLPPKPWDKNTTDRYNVIDKMLSTASTFLNADIQLAKNIVSDALAKGQSKVPLSKSESAIVKIDSISAPPNDPKKETLKGRYAEFINLMNQNEYLYKQLAALINIKFAGEYMLERREMPSQEHVNKLITEIEKKITMNEAQILAKKSEIKKLVLSDEYSKDPAYTDILESIKPPTQAALQERFRVHRDMFIKNNMLKIASDLTEAYDQSFAKVSLNYDAISKTTRNSGNFQELLSSQTPRVRAMASKWGSFDVFSPTHNKSSAYHQVVSKNPKIQSELFLMQNALNNVNFLENKRLATAKLLDALNRLQAKRAVIANISSDKTLLNSLPDDMRKEMVKMINTFDKRTSRDYSEWHEYLTNQIKSLDKQIDIENRAVAQHDDNLTVARRECIRDLSNLVPMDHVKYIKSNLLQELRDHNVTTFVTSRISLILSEGTDPDDSTIKLTGARQRLEHLNKVLASEGKTLKIPAEVVKGYTQMFSNVEKRMESARSNLESERVKLRDASHIVKPAAQNESERVKAIIQSLEAAHVDAKKMTALLTRQADFISSEKDIKLNNNRLAKYTPAEYNLLHLINVLKKPNQDEKTIKDAFTQAIANKDISVTTRALLQSLSKQYNDRAKKPSLVGRIFSSSESRKPTDQPDSTIGRTVKR